MLSTADITMETKKKAGCTRARWENILFVYKIGVGLGLLFTGLYDYVQPAIAGNEIVFEVRNLTIDSFNCLLAVLFLVSSCNPAVLNPFGFLKTSTGMGCTLLFAGFLLIKTWDFTQMDTYLGCYVLSASLVYFLDTCIRGCCCPKPKHDAESGPESEGLLANENGAPLTK